MELRCATDENLTRWGAPEYIYPIYYWRGLPYDPVGLYNHGRCCHLDAA
jgi:hypothetical protein